MGMGQAFFGFNGRLRRGEYFGMTLVSVIALLAAFFLVVAVVPPHALDMVIYGYLALSGWIGAALVAKRLHDIGMPGSNAVWIVPIQLAAGWFAGRGTPLAVILALASLGTGLWLLFTRGEAGRNAYGPEPE